MRDPLMNHDAEQVKDCAEVYHASRISPLAAPPREVGGPGRSPGDDPGNVMG
jgi:hypothetical protein